MPMFLSAGEGENAAEKMRAFFSPSQIDHQIRQAIQFCWMALPKNDGMSMSWSGTFADSLIVLYAIFGRISMSSLQGRGRDRVGRKLNRN